MIAGATSSSSSNCLRSGRGGDYPMAGVTQYRQLIQKLLEEYSHIRANNETVEAEAIFDTQQDHYQVVHVG